MSSMLEQAILDAKDLKEASLRSAQQTIIEKYSKEYEHEIERILEQVDPAGEAFVDPGMGAETPMATTTSLPVSAEAASNDSDKDSNLFDKLDYSFTDGEIIGGKAYPTGVVEIDLDSLTKFSFSKNKEAPSVEQLALQELKNLMLKEQYDDLRDYGDESDGGEDIEDTEQEGEYELDDTGMFPFDDDEEDEDGTGMFPFDDDDEDLEFEDETEETFDDSESLEDDEMEFELDFETDEDEDDDEDSEEDEDEDPDEDEEDEDLEVVDEIVEPFGKDDKKSCKACGKKRCACNSKPLEEKIRLDWKRGGPRSKWTGMSHEEAEHDVQLEELHNAIEEMERKNDGLKQSNKKLKAGLAESIKMIRSVSSKKELLNKKVANYEGKLDEMRILNYKLLYTNKALSDESLNDRQKHKIAESLDNANTMEEIKLLYETLQSTMREPRTNRGPKSLSEAVERRSSSFLLKPSVKEERKQEDFADRMKRLAGLQKNV